MSLSEVSTEATLDDQAGSTSRSSSSSERILILEPGRAERNYWWDLWHYRELFAILAWRDVAVRYKQTVIGVAWAVIRPFLTMVIFTIVFGRLANLPSDGTAPYPLMVFAGMLPWFLFSSVLSEASNSLVGNANLDQQGLLPAPDHSGVVGCRGARRFRDQPRSLLCVIMVWYGFLPDWQIVFLPVFVAARRAREPRAGALHHRAQRQVPRLPLHHSVHRAVRPLRVAGRLLERRGPGEVAASVQPQPDGRRHRRFPLVPARRREPALPAGLPAQPRLLSPLFLWLGIALLPRDREHASPI